MSDVEGPEAQGPGVPPPPPGAPADGPRAPADRNSPLPPPGSGSGQYLPPPTGGGGQGAPPSWDVGSGGPAPTGGGPASWSPGPQSASGDSNGVALAALVVGIVSLLFAVVGLFVLPLFLSIPGGVVAIVLGVIGRRRAKAGADRSGQAVAGLVTGIVALVVSAIWISVVAIVGSQFVAEFSSEVAELEACIEETGDQDLCAERFSEEVFEQLEP
jgi:hypothetical protein